MKASRESQASERPPTDLRRLRRETSRRLLWLVVFVLVAVGGGLIALVYGAPAAALGALCLLAGAGVMLALWLMLSLMGKWAGEE